MPIRVQCTNPDCGRTMSFREQFAGKKTRCPSCDTVVTIPDAEDEDEILEAEEEQPRERGRRRPARARPARDDDSPLEDDYEEDDVPRRRRPAVARPRRRSRRDDDLDDDDWDEPIVPPHREPLTIVLTYLGIVLIGAIGSAPYFSWISLPLQSPKADLKFNGMGTVKMEGDVELEEKVDADVRPEGMIFLIACCSVAGILLIGYTLALLNVGNAAGIAKTVTLIGVGASLCFLTWVICWFWKVKSLVTEIEKAKVPVAEETSTGLQLIAPLGICVAAAFLFSYLAGRYVKKVWVYACEGIGVIVTAVLLVTIIKSWDASDLWDGIGETVSESVKNAPRR